MSRPVDGIHLSGVGSGVENNTGATAHVLFLIDQLCGRGGAESALLNTVRWLPDRFRCTIFTYRLNRELPMVGEFPCTVKALPLSRTYDWNAFRLGSQLARFIKAESVDIVHTFFPSSDLWGGVVTKLSRRPILISSRRDMGILRKPQHRVAYRALQGMFDCVLANSEEVRKYSIEQDGLDPAVVKTIYNGLDTSKYPRRTSPQADRRTFRVEGASHVITSIGNLRAVKGFDAFIRVASIVCREFPQAKFVIAGAEDPAEPALRSQLCELISALGVVNNVKFLGPVSDIPALLSVSSVFCLLSRSEGFSNALIEAMACGIPCVATRVGGNPEAITDHDTGFVVESDDPPAAAGRILELLRDPVRATEMGKRGQDVAHSRFSSQTYIDKLVQVYDELLSRREQGTENCQ